MDDLLEGLENIGQDLSSSEDEYKFGVKSNSSSGRKREERDTNTEINKFMGLDSAHSSISANSEKSSSSGSSKSSKSHSHSEEESNSNKQGAFKHDFGEKDFMASSVVHKQSGNLDVAFSSDSSDLVVKAVSSAAPTFEVETPEWKNRMNFNKESGPPSTVFQAANIIPANPPSIPIVASKVEVVTKKPALPTKLALNTQNDPFDLPSSVETSNRIGKPKSKKSKGSSSSSDSSIDRIAEDLDK
jgi:hypothetical protein